MLKKGPFTNTDSTILANFCTKGIKSSYFLRFNHFLRGILANKVEKLILTQTKFNILGSTHSVLTLELDSALPNISRSNIIYISFCLLLDVKTAFLCICCIDIIQKVLLQSLFCHLDTVVHRSLNKLTVKLKLYSLSLFLCCLLL